MGADATEPAASRGSRRRSTAEVVGVPALPPPALASWTDRMRAALAVLHRGLAPPPVQVLEGLFGLLDHAVLGALCHLGIPDRLDGPVPVAELARRIDADEDVVRRLVAYAAGRGWVRVDRRGRARPTRTTRFLRRDHPGGWRAWVEFATGAEVTAAVAHLGREPRVPDPFTAANGASFFDWQAAHPDRHLAFDAAMAAGGRLHGLTLAAAIDWSGDARVCDVGGGTGALLRVLLDRHPHLCGVLSDLPPVVARAPAHPRIETVGGDAFVGLPGGCDTYLFVNVLHDWDDAAAVRLLGHVVPAGGDGARAIVVEGERRPGAHDTITVTRSPGSGPPVVGVRRPACWAGGQDHDEASPSYARADRPQAP
ncbi:MAG TPA: methyltransferase [Acidimicrobiales bacterium]